MEDMHVPIHKQILFKVIAPVIIVGLLCSTILVTYLSSPLKSYLREQFDSSLKQASTLALQVCKDSFNYLLELRLENNIEMNQVMKKETMDRIKNISNNYPHIHLVVVNAGQNIEASSMGTLFGKLATPLGNNVSEAVFDYQLGGKPVKCHIQFFPFWDWHIISFVFDTDYHRPFTMSYKIIYLSAACVFLAILLTLLAVFHLFIKQPLTRILKATAHVAEGSMNKIENVSDNEIGRLTVSFNHMIDSLEHEKASVEDLIHELQRNANFVKALLNTVPIPVFYKDKDGYYQGGNQAFANDIGIKSPESVIGKNDCDLGFAERFRQYRRDDKAVMDSGKSKLFYEETRQRPDGKITWLITSKVPMRDETKEITGVLGVYQDITDRKQAEEEIRNLRNYLSNIIDSMPSILICVDKKNQITQWNLKAAEQTGILPDAAMGERLEHVFPSLKNELVHVKKAIDSQKIYHGARYPKQEKNQTVYNEITIYPLVADGVDGAVIRIDDVSEKARMEEMMVQSEKMLSVGGLAAGMAHEINNPLAGMMQNANLMKTRLETIDMPANLNAAQELGVSMKDVRSFMEKRGIFSMLEAIHQSGLRAAEIVHSMLSFARKSEADVSSYHPEQLMDKIIELAATDYDLKKQYDFKSIEIIKQYDKNLPMLLCEGAKIQQVLLNILRNGAQAMQRAKMDTPKFILRIYTEKESEMICMEIEDNGPGMDEETRLKVFDPFFTTKPVGIGTGLGLSVSYFIITENHKGTMDVCSKPGKGATFIIRLPLKRFR